MEFTRRGGQHGVWGTPSPPVTPKRREGGSSLNTQLSTTYLRESGFSSEECLNNLPRPW